MRRALALLDARIDARARASREQHPWWPCGEGCDDCCRSLARSPELTEAEWARLRDAIASLPTDVRDGIVERVRDLASTTSGPVVCPMLDRVRGSCLVYDARPIACRTYGFYAERDGGLHCGKVTRAVDANETVEAQVVWGNGESIADELRTHGATRPLEAWFDSR